VLTVKAKIIDAERNDVRLEYRRINNVKEAGFSMGDNDRGRLLLPGALAKGIVEI
jgi:hypothetical protein